jgi:hypothetical protein
LILDVEHQIQPGSFQTSFTGVRQGIYDLPAIDNFLQSINQNLLTNLEEILKIKKNIPTIQGITNNQKTNQIVQDAETTPDASNSCVSNVDVNAYPDYQNVPPRPTNISADEFANVINKVVPADKQALKVLIYAMTYIRSFVKDTTTKGNGNFKGYNDNLGGISLYYNWGETRTSFLKQYSCINVKGSGLPNGTSEPLVGFESVEKYVEFMASRLNNNVQRILNENMGLAKYYVCFWPKENVSVSILELGRTIPNKDGIYVENLIKSTIRQGTYDINGLINELTVQMNRTPIFYDFVNGFTDFATKFSVTGDFSLNFNFFSSLFDLLLFHNFNLDLFLLVFFFFILEIALLSKT